MSELRLSQSRVFSSPRHPKDIPVRIPSNGQDVYWNHCIDRFTKSPVIGQAGREKEREREGEIHAKERGERDTIGSTRPWS